SRRASPGLSSTSRSASIAFLYIHTARAPTTVTAIAAREGDKSIRLLLARSVHFCSRRLIGIVTPELGAGGGAALAFREVGPKIELGPAVSGATLWLCEKRPRGG